MVDYRLGSGNPTRCCLSYTLCLVFTVALVTSRLPVCGALMTQLHSRGLLSKTLTVIHAAPDQTRETRISSLANGDD